MTTRHDLITLLGGAAADAFVKAVRQGHIKPVMDAQKHELRLWGAND